MRAWHFLREDKRLGYDDGRVVQVGKTYRLESGHPVLCANGMHGSLRLIDALGYAPGPIVCRVDITGDVAGGDDKIVGRERKVLAMADATLVLHEFACRCAEDALRAAKIDDSRCFEAIRAKRRWLAGEIGSAAASAAARAAASAAAWDAAWDAARDAASAAARAAAWDAALAAAWDAARDAQNRRLTAMVSALLRATVHGEES